MYRKRLNRYTRLYAALFHVASHEFGLTATMVSKRLGISQSYARDLLESWVNMGLILRLTQPYRKNASRVIYFMGRTELKRYERMGYKAQAIDSANANRDWNRAKNLEKLQSMGF